jgi:uncharacterized protein (DUF952 family)
VPEAAVARPLFHIAHRDAWLAARAAGVYSPPSLAEVGFIHLSTRAQWLDTLVRFYRGERDLVLLELDAARLGDAVRFERVDDDDFPHLYAPLAVVDVIAARELPIVRERPTLLAHTPAFEACVRGADPRVAEVAVVRVDDHGRPTSYVCLGARPGEAGGIALRDVIRAEATLPAADRVARAGWLQIGAFPRDERGDLDEPWLLVRVQELVDSD